MGNRDRLAEAIQVQYSPKPKKHITNYSFPIFLKQLQRKHTIRDKEFTSTIFVTYIRVTKVGVLR